MFSIRSLFVSALALAQLSAGQHSTRQTCPSDSVSIFESCICPYNTEFQISSLYAILGVNAKDFYKYTASFYDIAWQGITKLTHHGPDYKVGTWRTFTSPTPEGNLTFAEKLDTFQTSPDGSYLARISQYNTPVEYAGHNGSFSGYWITFNAEYAAQYETALKWTVYACFTGHPFDFAAGHVHALNGLLDTMDKAGLVKGNSTQPYTVQNF